MEYGQNAPHFNWGRKDPLPPSTGLSNTNKPIYGTYSSVNNMSTTDIASTIRMPYYFNTYYNSSLELWNVGNTVTTVNVNPVVKSVYDPSPAGFCLPPSGAAQGWDVSGRSYWQGTTGKSGRYVYNLGAAMGEPIFFASLGRKEGYSSFSYVGGDGYYWTACPYSEDNGYDVYCDSGCFNTTRSDPRSRGNSVRPVAE